MKVRVCYTVDANNDLRGAIRHQRGECGTLATREEVRNYFERVGESEIDDIMEEWRGCEDGCQP